MHELESMFYVMDEAGNGRPWHGLGTPVSECLTSEEAIVKAGLDWEVEKRPVFTKEKVMIPVPDGGEAQETINMIEVPDHFAVVRKTDGKPLGVVGSRYTCFQNKQAFAFFDEVVESKEAIYETAGSLRGGKIIWIMSKLPGHIGWSEDPVEQWLILSNAHDGTRQVNLMAAPVRVVCMNTLNAAIQSAKVNFEMRHTSGIIDRAVDAREGLRLAIEYFDQMDAMMKLLRAREMTAEETKAFVSALFPIKVKEEEDQENGLTGAVALEIGPRIKKYIEKVEELIETGKGADIPGVKGTAWGAFNAACEFADHWQPVKDKCNQLQKKLDSIWFGSAQKFKQRAFSQLTEMVE